MRKTTSTFVAPRVSDESRPSSYLKDFHHSNSKVEIKVNLEEKAATLCSSHLIYPVVSLDIYKKVHDGICRIFEKLQRDLIAHIRVSPTSPWRRPGRTLHNVRITAKKRRPTWPNISQLQSLKIRRSANLMYFRNVVRRIFKLWNWEKIVSMNSKIFDWQCFVFFF